MILMCLRSSIGTDRCRIFGFTRRSEECKASLCLELNLARNVTLSLIVYFSFCNQQVNTIMIISGQVTYNSARREASNYPAMCQSRLKIGARKLGLEVVEFCIEIHLLSIVF